jgi:hypothetical protein
MARHDCPSCSCPPPPDQWQPGREVRINDHGNSLVGYLAEPPVRIEADDGGVGWLIQVTMHLMHGTVTIDRTVDANGIDLHRTGNYARVQRTRSEIEAGR